MPKDHSTLAESIKIEVAFRVENELKLIESGAESITVKSGIGSGKENRVPDAVQRVAMLRRAGTQPQGVALGVVDPGSAAHHAASAALHCIRGMQNGGC